MDEGGDPPRFRDRRDAGTLLAGSLAHVRAQTGAGAVAVLGLARGGVVVARVVADALRAPLDVCVVRKLAVPRWPELAVGAIADGGAVVNGELLRDLGVTEDLLAEVTLRETAEMRRRERVYRSDRDPVDVRDRTVVLVDDGIATGASMLAAVRSMRGAGARRVIAAAPVGPAPVCRRLRGEVDEVVCPLTPPHFRAVGETYEHFHQITDDEVREALAARPP